MPSTRTNALNRARATISVVAVTFLEIERKKEVRLQVSVNALLELTLFEFALSEFAVFEFALFEFVRVAITLFFCFGPP